jgi:hypothetical protein
VLHLPLGAIVAVVLCLSHLFTSWALSGNRFDA